MAGSGPRATEVEAASPRGGVWIIAGLAAVFFALLALIVLNGGRKPMATTGSDGRGSLYVIPTALKVRTQPGFQAPVVTTVSRGDELEPIEERGRWVKVKAPDGIVGWSEKSYLEGSAEHRRRIERAKAIRSLPALQGKVTDRTPLYAGPGIFYPVIGELDAGERIQVYTRDHDFYAVQKNGEIAYADVESIDVAAGEGTPSFEVAEVQPTTEEPELIAPEPEPVEPLQPPLFDEPPAAERPLFAGGVYPTVPPGGTEPRVISQRKPIYPFAARRAGIEGAVVIRAIVRRDGTVDDATVIRDLPFGLGEAAKDAVSRWLFEPATTDGHPIDVYYTVTVNFRLH